MRASKFGLAFLWLASSSSGIGLAFGKKIGSVEDQEENSNCHSHDDGMCSHCHDPCDTGDVFFQWNCIALEANVMDHNGREASGDQLSLTQGPPASARALAMIHTAMFDAYNVVAGGGHYETYLPNLRDTISGAGASIDAAVATAAHHVLMNLYADDSPIIVAMVEGALERTLDGIPSVPYKERGIAVGQQVAKACMEDRKDDGYAPDNPYLMHYPHLYNPTGNPGDHDVDPINPNQGFFNPGAGYMTPFGMDAIAEFRAPIPPGLMETQDGFAFDPSDADYMLALMEVMEKGIFRGGEAGEPFPDNDPGYDIANFWSYNGSPCTGTPPRLYNMIARDIAKQKRNSLDDNALLFTMLNVGLGNAGIASWESKYHYRLWRPIMGIRSMEGGADWSPLGASRSNPYPDEQNFSPPFPAYTSGHATFGAVAFKTLINFYQTADIPFSFVSDEWNSRTLDQFGRTRPFKSRTFPTLTVAMAENAASRVYNGVHWRFDGTAGVEVGCRIADYIFTEMFLPIPLHGKNNNNNGRPRRIAMPDGDFESAINCILENPSYQDSGDCAY